MGGVYDLCLQLMSVVTLAGKITCLGEYNDRGVQIRTTILYEEPGLCSQ